MRSLRPEASGPGEGSRTDSRVRLGSDEASDKPAVAWTGVPFKRHANEVLSERGAGKKCRAQRPAAPDVVKRRLALNPNPGSRAGSVSACAPDRGLLRIGSEF